MNLFGEFNPLWVASSAFLRIGSGTVTRFNNSICFVVTKNISKTSGFLEDTKIGYKYESKDGSHINIPPTLNIFGPSVNTLINLNTLIYNKSLIYLP